MDSVLDIIWIICIGIFAVGGSLIKRSKQEHAQQGKPKKYDPFEELLRGRPIDFGIPPEEKSIDKPLHSKSPEQSTEAQSLEGQSLEGQSLEVKLPQAMSRRKATKHKVQKSVAPQQLKHVAEQDSADEDPSEFDLKSAIIYSEIMKPKFQDEE